jgi:hypothetical protein
MHVAKKIWFSVPLSHFWNDVYPTYKKSFPTFSDEEIYKHVRYRAIKSSNIDIKHLNDIESFVTGFEMWWEDHNKTLLHIFLVDKTLKSFLENLRLADLDGIKKYLMENGTDKKVYYFRNNTEKRCVSYYYGIHVPYETDGYAFQLNIYENDLLELFSFHGRKFVGVTNAFYNDLINKNDNNSKEITRHFRLAVNILAYMNCFPECVLEGVPKITIDRNEKRTDKNITLSVSDKISDSENVGRTIKPHFRSGYFKHLQSEFYTNKRGQLVFIHETMVNAKAKTVYKSKEKGKIDTFVRDSNNSK